MYVIKRDGTRAIFDPNKIINAINKAMMQTALIKLISNEQDEATLSLVYCTVKDIILPAKLTETEKQKNFIRSKLIGASKEQVERIAFLLQA